MHVECTKRERRMSILLSDDEQLIVDRYLEKYKITNKSRWLRETILTSPDRGGQSCRTGRSSGRGSRCL